MNLASSPWTSTRPAHAPRHQKKWERSSRGGDPGAAAPVIAMMKRKLKRESRLLRRSDRENAQLRSLLRRRQALLHLGCHASPLALAPAPASSPQTKAEAWAEDSQAAGAKSEVEEGQAAVGKGRIRTRMRSRARARL